MDTTINLKKDGTITSSLYQKPTDSCGLLHRDSFHPWSSKAGVIYSQALRYRKVTTDDQELLLKLINLKHHLVGRGYEPKTIDKQLNKILTLSQSDLLDNSKRESDIDNNKGRNLPFIIPFDNRTIKIRNILKTHWNIITEDDELKCIWSRPPILALERHKNIGDVLTNTKFTIDNTNRIDTESI